MAVIVRKKLYGKDASEEDWIREVSRLRVGDKRRKILPQSYGQIGKILGITRQWVSQYIKKAIDSKILELDPKTKREVIPEASMMQKTFQSYSEKNPITTNLLVSDYIQDIRNRKGGKGIVVWQDRINCLQTLFNTCKVEPSQLIINAETTEKIIKNFADKAKDGQVLRVRSNTPVKGAPELIIHRVKMAVRDFCGYYGVTWRRGTDGIMSGKVIRHGQYSDVLLTDAELEKSDHFLLNEYGLDSDVYRLFWVGVESCSRKKALLGMTTEWKEHISKSGNKTFIMTAIESKTQHYKGGKWVKYIKRPKTQESIRLQRKRGEQFLWSSSKSESRAVKDFSKAMKLLFKHLEKSQDYFYNHAFHALRHIGAHYWLRKTKYNYGFVAKIGGWMTIDELKFSYGEMPPEVILDLFEEKGFGVDEI